MTSDKRARFDGIGLFAIRPEAFGLDYAVFCPPACAYTEPSPAVAVVHISGPLSYRASAFDGYAGIRARVEAALATEAHTVVMHIDSPGGDVWGAFDTSRALRAAARKANKRLIAFTDSQACSSGYALACAADQIIASKSATVGSIGVIATQVEQSRAEKAAGLTYAIRTSGERKADGNPHLPQTEASLAAMQRDVDASAQLFYELVAEQRVGLSVTAVTALQADAFLGAHAQAVGLVDLVASWDEALESLQAPPARATVEVTPNKALKESPPMPDDDKKKEDDEKAKALAAAKEDEDEKAKKAKAKKAEDEEKKDDEDKKESKAMAALAAQVAALSAELASERAEKKAQAEAAAALKLKADREALFAARPDLPATVVSALADLPLERVKAIVDATPKGVVNPHAPPHVQATQGDASGRLSLTTAERLAARPNHLMDQVAGLVPMRRVTVVEGNVQSFGALRPATEVK